MTFPPFVRRSLTTIAILLCFVSVSAAAMAADADVRVTVSTDRDTALYETDERATFTIQVWKGKEPLQGEGTLSWTVDDFLPGEPSLQGESTPDGQPVTLTTTMSKPGFLRCRASWQPKDGKPVRAAVGAGFSPQQIPLSLPVPDDFDEYWDEQKRQLAKIPLQPELTAVESPEASLDCYDVQMPCLGGAPVSGYFARPKTAEPGSLPAILWVHGAGVRSSVLGNAVKGANAGMLSMDINAHGLPNGRPGEFYRNLAKGELKHYRQAGRESRDTVYFRGMFLRLIRAIDFLASQPEWDGKHLIVIGHSQGGGQSLAAGGLDSRVTMIAPGVPAICDHSGRAAGRINGWPKLVPSGPDGTPDPQILEAARYVDAVNFATRCRAEAIMSVGFIDAVCPPSSCYAAFNALQGNKTMVNEPSMGHAAPAHIQEAFFDRVLKHAGRQPAATSQ